MYTHSIDTDSDTATRAAHTRTLSNAPMDSHHWTGLDWRSIPQEWVYLGRIRSHSKPICSLMFGKFPDGSVQVRT